YPSHLLPLDQLMGVQHQVAISLDEMPDDAEWKTERLAATPALVHQVIDLLREGLARGVTQPRQILGDVEGQLTDLAAAVPAFAELRQFVVDEYLPGCRESIACADLPD